MQEIFAVALFALVLLLIALELVNRTVIALLGAGILLAFGVVGQEEAGSEFVDWNTIGLLAGMMIIVVILEKTGVFEYLAIKSAQWGKARPGRILILLALVTAFLSAFLDNVTTVILMVPVTFLIADALDSSPMPFLLTQVMASNIGGAATLIGDPPNILIGSAAGLSFAEFVVNLTPVVLLTLPAVLGVLYLMFRKELHYNKDAEEVILSMDAAGSIRDRVLLRKSLIVLGLVILAFFLHGALHLEAATIALLGAAALMLYARVDVEEVLRDVEWPTLLFFVGLFIVVEGVIHVGIIDEFARGLFELTGGDLTVTSLTLMWVSAIASGIIDNIPYTATLIPVVEGLAERGVEVEPLWWSLALGADLGGNATIIGASANVIIASLAGRAGQPISFRRFLPYGVATVVLSLAISSLYVWLRYLL
jgi:Na+/H+ antiporter NhaD/arsenite permease-like protein